MRKSTRLVLVESPGSNTMEVQDVPAIAAAAHAGGALVAADTTWATPLHFDAFRHGPISPSRRSRNTRPATAMS